MGDGDTLARLLCWFRDIGRSAHPLQATTAWLALEMFSRLAQDCYVVAEPLRQHEYTAALASEYSICVGAKSFPDCAHMQSQKSMPRPNENLTSKS